VRFNHHSKGFHRIPRQSRLVTNWRDCDAAQCNSISLAIWFREEAVDAWRERFRKTSAGQPRHSSFAIEPTPTLPAVSRHQAEALIGSITQLLQIDLPVPDHSTLGPVQGWPCSRTGELNSIVDRRGLKLCGGDKRVIGDALRSPEDARRLREFKIIDTARNAILELGCPVCKRRTLLRSSCGLRRPVSMQTEAPP
jgi:hypothetical protein